MISTFPEEFTFHIANEPYACTNASIDISVRYMKNYCMIKFRSYLLSKYGEKNAFHQC